MRRIHDNGMAETADNIQSAWESFSDGKGKRDNIRKYEKNLQANLERVQHELEDESWEPSPYISKEVMERKRRKLAKAPIHDHVLEAAAIKPYETQLYDYIAWQCPAVRPNMGQKGMLRAMRNELFGNSQQECYYYLSMDAHHYFPLMDHEILKKQISRKVKPGKMQRILFKVVDSYLQGAPLGIKISQIYGQLYLAQFDRMAMRFFDIADNPEKLRFWTAKYIEGRIVTAKTPEDYEELCRGPQYLAEKFKRYAVEGIRHYHRFVDNIIVLHEDKTFLGIFKTLAIMILAREFHVIINKDYNIRPTYTGIRIIGYVFFHDRVLLGKRNKQDLCRHVHKLFKRGKSEEEIRIAQSSRFGYAKHVNTIHLIKSIGMEKTLGKIIKGHRVKAPFEGMTSNQKVKFSSICRTLAENNRGGVNWDKKIFLEDYLVTDSKIDKTKVKVNVADANGEMKLIEKEVPGKVLAIRFKKIIETVTETMKDGSERDTYKFEKERDKEGQTSIIDAEFYSFTGSKILIDQAQNDFGREDLPAPTVIQQFKGKNGQTFFKFT